MTGDKRFLQDAAEYAATWADTTGREFVSPEIEEVYALRTKRVLDAVALKKPDQVPVNLMTVGYLRGYGDVQAGDAFYNWHKVTALAEQLHARFDLPYSIITNIHSGPTLDTLGIRLIRWPGSKVPGHALDDGTSHQYIEDEYMRVDEYDELICNPEGYMLRRYLPSICTELQGLTSLPSLYNFTELFGFTGTLSELSKGKPARKALETLLKAADQASDAAELMTRAQQRIASHYGAPSLIAGVTFVPYDIIGDTMRCTRGITLDLYRYPEKVLAAVNALIPMAVQMGVGAVKAAENPFIFIPVHKGSDIFLSREQFDTFYWPSARATFLALIEAGCIPVIFLEGPYHHRLETIAANPLPAGKSIWLFSQIDMKEAKQKIGDWACIAGNVPASLFSQGSAEMLESYCKDLIESCGYNGGFFLFPGTILDQAKPENVKTFIECGARYGK